MTDTILIVDDSTRTREVVRRNLASEGYVVLSAAGVEEAARLLQSQEVALVITDRKMPRIDGLELVRLVREHHPTTPVIVITGYASIDSAVEAIKEGAEEYLPKPFTDEELLGAVRRVLENARMARAGRGEEADAAASSGLLGTSPAMRRVREFVRKAAESAATVLVMGESGTGKELVARAIHYQGRRAAAPFVPVNCAGIPDGLVESELFGHMRGAFTSATTNRAGFFLTADGGTLFLDEIGELPLNVQAKLLRVLEDREVLMLGAERPRKVDVRVIAATNKNLSQQVERGAFREDLYFRLNVLSVELPPLRDRGDDLLLLVKHFVARLGREAGNSLQLSPRTLEALRAHHWPGNIRELHNLIQRIAVLSGDDPVEVSDLPAFLRSSLPAGPPGELCTLAEMEREHISRVLERVQGNKTQAARILGIDRKTLRARLQQSGLEPTDG